MKVLSKRWLLAAATLAIVGVAAVVGSQAFAGSSGDPASAKGLGPLTGLLPRDHLTVESAIQVDLSKESVRLPLYKGKANGETVWYVLLDASDSGIAHDLGVNYAPKLGNLAIGDPEAVQTVTLESPTPAQNKFGQAVVDFQGAPDFSPTRIAEPGPTGFPLAKFQPGAVAGTGLQPVHPDRRLADRLQRADRRDRGRPVRRRPPHEHRRPRARHPHRRAAAPQGQYAESWVDLLFVKGFDAGAADRLHLDRRRPAADRGARALDLRAGARQGGLQRRRRLPRLRPRAAVRLHQRPDRRRTTSSRRASSTWSRTATPPRTQAPATRR